jgi:2-iminobutanoate/2-iminopropanoate deaminase
LDLRTGEVVRGSIEEETRLRLPHVGKILEAAGYSFEDVVKCNYHLADIRDFHGFDRVYYTNFFLKFALREPQYVGSVERN